MKTVQFTCNFCKADITYSTPGNDIRIEVTNVERPSKDGYVTRGWVPEETWQTAHFCNRTCLINHLNANPQS